MRKWMPYVAVLGLLGPSMASAADVFLRQERDGAGVEFPGSGYVSATYPDAATVPNGYPTEPKGCQPANATDVCALGTASSYGWPSLTSTNATTKDAYITNINFWNNEAVLADQTQYPAKVIKNPFDRAEYSGPHTQYKIPGDFNPCASDGSNADTCWASGYPKSAYVTGYEVLQASNTDPTFTVVAYTGNSAGPGDRNDKTKMSWIDERHFPAAYPFIFKGCHQSTCTPSGGSPTAGVTYYPGAPFPIQVRDLGAIPSNWSVDVSGASSSAIFDVAYDIWFEIPNRFYAQVNPWEHKTGCDWNTNFDNCSTYYAGMPEANPVVTQPWGTELMVWINAGGFSGFNGGDPSKGAITPAGTRVVQNVSLGGIAWDIWVGQGRDPKQSQPTSAGAADESDRWNGYWNIVSFVARTPTNALSSFDTKLFINYMLDNMQSSCPIGYQDGVPVTGQTAPCVDPSWFLTEIGAGFEIWRDGAGLKTTNFDVKPTFRDGSTRPDGQATTIPAGINIMTDRWTDPVGGKVSPIINWQKHMQFWANGFCAGGDAQFDIWTNDSFYVKTDGSLAWCDGVNKWASATNASKTTACDTTGVSFPADPTRRYKMVNVNGRNDQWYGIMRRGYNERMWDRGLHGQAQVHFYCNGTEDTTKTVTLYIDPSGQVLRSGSNTPINGAVVKLLKQQTNGTFALASNTPTATFTPNVNPQLSAGAGNYAWDVVPGTYQVTAEKSGCWMPGNPSQTVVASPVLPVVNDPFFNVNLLLECPGPASTGTGGDTPGLQVTVTTINNWTAGSKYGKGGFCKGVRLKNTTGATITGWQVTVTVEASTLYDKWNANYSQPSTTKVRIQSADNWLKVLQPGQQTDVNALGFCSDRK